MSGLARFLSVVVVIASVILIVSIVFGSGVKTAKQLVEPSVKTNDTISSTPFATPDPTITPEKDTKSVLYDGNTLKATFLKLYDQPGVEGVCYFQIEFENKSNQKSWIYLENCSVNGYSVMAMSGIPTYIDPGNKSKNPFIFSYQQFDAESVAEIRSIKFDIVQCNEETLNEFFRASDLTITF